MVMVYFIRISVDGTAVLQHVKLLYFFVRTAVQSTSHKWLELSAFAYYFVGSSGKGFYLNYTFFFLFP
jgi:hypothetical protein